MTVCILIGFAGRRRRNGFNLAVLQREGEVGDGRVAVRCDCLAERVGAVRKSDQRRGFACELDIRAVLAGLHASKLCQGLAARGLQQCEHGLRNSLAADNCIVGVLRDEHELCAVEELGSAQCLLVDRDGCSVIRNDQVTGLLVDIRIAAGFRLVNLRDNAVLHCELEARNDLKALRRCGLDQRVLAVLQTDDFCLVALECDCPLFAVSLDGVLGEGRAVCGHADELFLRAGDELELCLARVRRNRLAACCLLVDIDDGNVIHDNQCAGFLVDLRSAGRRGLADLCNRAVGDGEGEVRHDLEAVRCEGLAEGVGAVFKTLDCSIVAGKFNEELAVLVLAGFALDCAGDLNTGHIVLAGNELEGRRGCICRKRFAARSLLVDEYGLFLALCVCNGEGVLAVLRLEVVTRRRARSLGAQSSFTVLGGSDLAVFDRERGNAVNDLIGLAVGCGERLSAGFLEGVGAVRQTLDLSVFVAADPLDGLFAVGHIALCAGHGNEILLAVLLVERCAFSVRLDKRQRKLCAVEHIHAVDCLLVDVDRADCIENGDLAGFCIILEIAVSVGIAQRNHAVLADGEGELAGDDREAVRCGLLNEHIGALLETFERRVIALDLDIELLAFGLDVIRGVSGSVVLHADKTVRIGIELELCGPACCRNLAADCLLVDDNGRRLIQNRDAVVFRIEVILAVGSCRTRRDHAVSINGKLEAAFHKREAVRRCGFLQRVCACRETRNRSVIARNLDIELLAVRLDVLCLDLRRGACLGIQNLDAGQLCLVIGNEPEGRLACVLRNRIAACIALADEHILVRTLCVCDGEGLLDLAGLIVGDLTIIVTRRRLCRLCGQIGFAVLRGSDLAVFDREGRLAGDHIIGLAVGCGERLSAGFLEGVGAVRQTLDLSVFVAADPLDGLFAVGHIALCAGHGNEILLAVLLVERCAFSVRLDQRQRELCAVERFSAGDVLLVDVNRAERVGNGDLAGCCIIAVLAVGVGRTRRDLAVLADGEGEFAGDDRVAVRCSLLNEHIGALLETFERCGIALDLDIELLAFGLDVIRGVSGFAVLHADKIVRAGIELELCGAACCRNLAADCLLVDDDLGRCVKHNELAVLIDTNFAGRDRGDAVLDNLAVFVNGEGEVADDRETVRCDCLAEGVSACGQTDDLSRSAAELNIVCLVIVAVLDLVRDRRAADGLNHREDRLRVRAGAVSHFNGLVTHEPEGRAVNRLGAADCLLVNGDCRDVVLDNQVTLRRAFFIRVDVSLAVGLLLRVCRIDNAVFDLERELGNNGIALRCNSLHERIFAVGEILDDRRIALECDCKFVAVRRDSLLIEGRAACGHADEVCLRIGDELELCLACGLRNRLAADCHLVDIDDRSVVHDNQRAGSLVDLCDSAGRDSLSHRDVAAADREFKVRHDLEAVRCGLLAEGVGAVFKSLDRSIVAGKLNVESAFVSRAGFALDCAGDLNTGHIVLVGDQPEGRIRCICRKRLAARSLLVDGDGLFNMLCVCDGEDLTDLAGRIVGDLTIIVSRRRGCRLRGQIGGAVLCRGDLAVFDRERRHVVDHIIGLRADCKRCAGFLQGVGAVRQTLDVSVFVAAERLNGLFAVGRLALRTCHGDEIVLAVLCIQCLDFLCGLNQRQRELCARQDFITGDVLLIDEHLGRSILDNDLAVGLCGNAHLAVGDSFGVRDLAGCHCKRERSRHAAHTVRCDGFGEGVGAVRKSGQICFIAVKGDEVIAVLVRLCGHILAVRLDGAGKDILIAGGQRELCLVFLRNRRAAEIRLGDGQRFGTVRLRVLHRDGVGAGFLVLGDQILIRLIQIICGQCQEGQFRQVRIVGLGDLRAADFFLCGHNDSGAGEFVLRCEIVDADFECFQIGRLIKCEGELAVCIVIEQTEALLPVILHAGKCLILVGDLGSDDDLCHTADRCFIVIVHLGVIRRDRRNDLTAGRKSERIGRRHIRFAPEHRHLTGSIRLIDREEDFLVLQSLVISFRNNDLFQIVYARDQISDLRRAARCRADGIDQRTGFGSVIVAVHLKRRTGNALIGFCIALFQLNIRREHSVLDCDDSGGNRGHVNFLPCRIDSTVGIEQRLCQLLTVRNRDLVIADCSRRLLRPARHKPRSDRFRLQGRDQRIGLGGVVAVRCLCFDHAVETGIRLRSLRLAVPDGQRVLGECILID